MRLQTLPCTFLLIDESIILSKMTLRSQNLSILGRLTSSGIGETMVQERGLSQIDITPL